MSKKYIMTISSFLTVGLTLASNNSANAMGAAHQSYAAKALGTAAPGIPPYIAQQQAQAAAQAAAMQAEAKARADAEARAQAAQAGQQQAIQNAQVQNMAMAISADQVRQISKLINNTMLDNTISDADRIAKINRIIRNLSNTDKQALQEMLADNVVAQITW